MKALSLDLRHRIVAALDAGQTQASVAQRFVVSLTSVERLARKKRDEESLVPRRHLGKTPLVQKHEYEIFEALAASRTDWTLQNLAQAWQQQGGKPLSAATVLRTLRRTGFSHKKSAGSQVSAVKKNEPLSVKK